jgi:creatinine amidohydrolase
MRLADMTWRDVRDYLRRSDALIIPVGTCEQHGPHLPLSTDTLIAEAFAERIAEESGIAIAPTVAYGVNLPCDRYVHGTAGLSFDAMRLAVRDLLEDWVRQGFRTFFVLTAHGCATEGYSFAHHEAIKEAALPLLTEDACEVFVMFPYWTDLGDILSGQSGVEHAGEVETSLALHLFPDLVRRELIDDPPDGGGEPRFHAYPEGIGMEPPEGPWSGAEGSPASASGEKGAAIFGRCLGPMLELIRERAGSPDES